ncbi:hypothetical protein [Alicyclobacillus pomorum]|uniref:hypothetical protein n=1 Tax=Alicyclobacillus pomorum TaxID=204470 RepID=UPI00047DCCF8|nr:hypothetical protein [Alicyclobacillus pomorum]
MVKIYADKRIQLALCIIYPIAVYFFLTEWKTSTWQPMLQHLINRPLPKAIFTVIHRVATYTKHLSSIQNCLSQAVFDVSNNLY